MTGNPASLDCELLLGQQDLVRRLARSLVFAQDHVDDVVQEAWLAAMRHPPREPAALRTWFGRVIENLARKHARAAVRRHRRERAAAAPEALPAVAEVLQREQQRKQVVDAVVGLPEPYRGVVLARFFEDLAPSEIARRRQIPAATVRSQLKRGLDMLRSKLDATYGDRRTWCLLLLPLARPEWTPGLLATFPLAATVSILTKPLCVAGALALAVLGVLWYANPGPDPAPLTAVADLDAPRADAGVQPAASAGADPLARVAAAATARPGGPDGVPASVPAGYRGRVLRPDGTPAAGELVRFLGVEPLAVLAEAGAGGRRDLPLVRAQTRTGVDGTFLVADLRVHGAYAVMLAADGKDRTVRLLQVAPGPEEIVDLGDLQLVAKAGLRGRVVDEQGAPLADAEVLCLDLPAVLRAVLPFDRFVPQHGGFLSLPDPDADDLARPANYATRLRAFLGADLFVATDLDRRPSLAIHVIEHLPWLETFWNELPIARGTSGSDGCFEIHGAQPGANWVLVRKPGFVPGGNARAVLSAHEIRNLGDQRLLRGEEVSGRVVDAGGRPVARAEVRIGEVGAIGYRGIAFAAAPVVADANGRFTVRGLSGGRILLAARATTSDPWHAVGPVDMASDPEIRLPATSTLVLHVVDAAGQPVAAPKLQVFVGPMLRELRRAGVQRELPLASRLQHGEAGALRLVGMPPGCYTLLVGAAGAVPQELTLRMPAAAPLRVVLAPCAPLRIAVADAAARPLPGCRIYLERDGAVDRAILPTDYGLPRWDSLPHYVGVTAGDGTLACGERPAGGMRVHALHPTHGMASVACAEGSTEVRVTMASPGELCGRVLDHGMPADPGRYALQLEPILPAAAAPVPPFVAGRIALSRDGTFSRRGVPPGRYAVRAVVREETPVSLSGFVEQVKRAVFVDLSTPAVETRVRTVEVSAGGIARLDFDLDPDAPDVGVAAARLVGSLVLGGSPARGAKLLRQNAGNQFAWLPVAEVGADGTFTVPQLAPGRQELQFQDADGAPIWQGGLDLAPGSERRLDLRIEVAAVHGTARFATGLPVADCLVTARGTAAGGTVTRSAKIALDGTFLFPALPHGTYEFVASGRDGRSRPIAHTVGAGGPALPQPLVLEEFLVFRGTVAGRPEGVELPLLLLRRENVTRGTTVDAEGRFDFGTLPPGVYALEFAATVGQQPLRLDPGQVDLTRGSLRDFVLHVRRD